MLRIGDVQLATNLLLAPVAGHCDLPFRLTARACGGIGLAFTDLLCPHGVLRQNPRTRSLMATDPRDRPLGMQLYGRDPHIMADAARAAADHGAAAIDINMGCPVDKVTKTFAGSMMLRTPDHTLRVAERLVRAVAGRAPVTAKLRLGFHHDDRAAAPLARRLVAAGIAAVTIHGRTAAQRFRGRADLDAIAEVVAAVHHAGNRRVPCIGNGDVRTPFDAAAMIQRTGCDGVMIARAALGAPWIFRDTHELLTTGRIANELTLRQRLDCIRTHFRHLLAMRDERYALNRIRQKISGYATHLGPCKPLRASLAAATTPAAFDAALDAFLNRTPHAADRVPLTWRRRAEQLAASSTPSPSSFSSSFS